MKSIKLYKLSRPHSLLSFMTMGALLLLSNCSTIIHDREICAVVPNDPTYGEWAGGAVCDKFLTTDRRVLTKHDWEALQNVWTAQSTVTECMNSSSLGDIKKEEEELCSKTSCDYNTGKATASKDNDHLFFAHGTARR